MARSEVQDDKITDGGLFSGICFYRSCEMASIWANSEHIHVLKKGDIHYGDHPIGFAGAFAGRGASRMAS
jgi:hypothetical protein